jgi:DNA polymerase III delta prime subunit
MPATSSTVPCKFVLPFVGRKKEVSRLQRLHAQGKHALILGPPGVGKTALVNHLKAGLGLLLCPQSGHVGSICESLEPQLGLARRDLKLVQRKQHLRQALAQAGRTVVFDGVNWTTPKLSSFLELAMERAPIWICARSEHAHDIGHFWTWLVRFEKIQLHAFQPAQTRELVMAAIQAGQIPREAMNIVQWLHRRSNGSPLILRQLFEELAALSYDLGNPRALRRLDLDRRIHQVFPIATHSAPPGRRSETR